MQYINVTLTGTDTPGQSGSENNGQERLLAFPMDGEWYNLYCIRKWIPQTELIF